MSLFSQQELYCCICRTGPHSSAITTVMWKAGVCSMRCYYEKDWREVLGIQGKAYYPDSRHYNERGYPRKVTDAEGD